LTAEKEAKGKDIIAFLGFGQINSPLEAKVSLSSVDMEGAAKT
jgi:hypothetical protein